MENTFTPETLLTEGKTKKIWEAQGPDYVIIESKDDLTAGDGAKHDKIAGKGALANQTTCNVFRLLQACGVPVAFERQIDDTMFVAEGCEMIPLEVVVRREAHGSYLKRRPDLSKGHVFPKLVLEFFLKTSGKQWKDHALPKDDPLMRFFEHRAELFLPDQPIFQQSPFLTLEDFPLKGLPKDLETIGQMALKTFLILEKAWQLLGRRLVDFKVEFGRNTKGELVLADVIDNDSWRVLDDSGQYIDKQVYRDGGALDLVTEKYRQVAELTGRFALPRQQVILWRASGKDDLTLFVTELEKYGVCGASDTRVEMVARSLHKEPVRAYQELTRLVQEVPDSVVIAYVGRSNGAGPTLSAHTTVPVITVPAGWKDCHEDVWSSLRTPSDTPVLTVLEPANAVLAALQILAMRNPRLYAELRLRQERRFVNITNI